jgi:3-oxocholest-4-en-26-oate---CoA ligase
MHYNIADLFECAVATCPERTAVVIINLDGSKITETYAGLNARANRLAGWLRAQGVGAGDHIGLHLYNGMPYLEGLLAACKLRAVPININYRYVVEELAYLYNDADLVGVIHEPDLADRVEGARKGLDKLTWTLTAGEAYDAAVASQSAEQSFGERSADDLYIIYTGGTTGMPKGVMWRQEDLFFAALQGGRPGGDPIERPEELAEVIGAGPEGVNIHAAAPLIHGSAQLATWICLFSGGKLGIVGHRSFNADLTGRLLDEEGMNVVNLVGDAMALPFVEMLESGKYKADSLVALSSAGAILSSTTKTRLQAALPMAMILNNYGASETGHQGTAITDAGGQPRFFMHGDATTVLGPDNKPVEPGGGVTGMLARKGNIPLGYYNDPEKTARTFKTIDGVRYVMPGDFALLNDDGTVTLLGRGSVCINTGGEKVYPEEVEEALKGHDDVSDAVVVGVPDPRWGERVTALIVCTEGADIDAIAAHVRTKVAGYKTPRQIFAIEHLNRHPTGKPDYRWSKEMAARLCADG